MAVPDLRPFAGPEHEPFALGTGPGKVLLIHGFPGTPAEMRPLGEALAGQGWHVRGVLLPGFGPDIPNMETRRGTDWLEAVRRGWQELASYPGPAVLAGYSMGAAIVLNLAAELRPDYLVLLAPFWRTATWVSGLVALARFFRVRWQPFKKADFSQPALREQMDRIIPGVNLDDPEVQAYIRTQFTLPVHTLNEILRLGRLAHRHARHLKFPTLVIQGSADPLASPMETRRLVRALGPQRVTYHEIEGGHDILQNKTIEPIVSSLVLSYLKA